MSLLQQILSRKADELRALAARRLPAPPPLRPFSLARRPGGSLSLLAEIKRRSPSAGALSTKLSVAERAAAYERGGATMLSVLVDRDFFDGAFEHLAEARAASTLPVLCKEFVVDERQLDAARAFGADAVLLIVRCLTPERVATLVAAARERGLEPLVEITGREEARVALDAGALLIGVNARDLDTLTMDPARAADTLASLPAPVTKLYLSGLATPEDVRKVRESPADAALVGEVLMRQDEPEALLRTLCDAAR